MSTLWYFHLNLGQVASGSSTSSGNTPRRPADGGRSSNRRAPPVPPPPNRSGAASGSASKYSYRTVYVKTNIADSPINITVTLKNPIH